MKMTLSMPSTSSSAVSVAKAIQRLGIEQELHLLLRGALRELAVLAPFLVVARVDDVRLALARFEQLLLQLQVVGHRLHVLLEGVAGFLPALTSAASLASASWRFFSAAMRASTCATAALVVGDARVGAPTRCRARSCRSAAAPGRGAPAPWRRSRPRGAPAPPAAFFSAAASRAARCSAVSGASMRPMTMPCADSASVDHVHALRRPRGAVVLLAVLAPRNGRSGPRAWIFASRAALSLSVFASALCACATGSMAPSASRSAVSSGDAGHRGLPPKHVVEGHFNAPAPALTC